MIIQNYGRQWFILKRKFICLFWIINFIQMVRIYACRQNIWTSINNYFHELFRCFGDAHGKECVVSEINIRTPIMRTFSDLSKRDCRGVFDYAYLCSFEDWFLLVFKCVSLETITNQFFNIGSNTRKFPIEKISYHISTQFNFQEFCFGYNMLRRVLYKTVQNRAIWDVFRRRTDKPHQ